LLSPQLETASIRRSTSYAGTSTRGTTRRGVGICGVFTYEVAETKVAQVMDFARANEQPLQCTMEKE
jgi:hypothetical protein